MQVFSCNFCQNFKATFYRTPLVAASSVSGKTLKSLQNQGEGVFYFYSKFESSMLQVASWKIKYARDRVNKKHLK